MPGFVDGFFGAVAKAVRLSSSGLIWTVESAWDDFVVPGQAGRPASVAPTFGAMFGTALYAWHFSEGDQLMFQVQLPHTWKPGTTVYLHVHWAIPVAGAGGGAENVQWQLDYMMADAGDAFPAAPTSVSSDIVDVQNDAIRMSYMADTPVAGIDLAGYEESAIIACLLTRKAAANPYGSDVVMMSFDFHIEVNSMGTSTRTPPWSK
jgi:hypothetical protein